MVGLGGWEFGSSGVLEEGAEGLKWKRSSKGFGGTGRVAGWEAEG